MPIGFVGGTDEEIRAGKAEPLLTTTQSAARLGVNERTFTELAKADVITPYIERIRNMPLYVASEVEALRVQRLKRGY